MNTMYLPAAPDVRDVFEEEIAALGGTVRDVYAEGDLLYARAVLPRAVEVRPGDAIHGGVAVRTHDTEILVHPYTHRVVCTNGAIAAVATDSRVVERVDVEAPSSAVDTVLVDLRAAIRACAAPAALESTAGAMRSAAERAADMMLHLMPVLTHLPPAMGASVLRRIVGRFEAQRDGSIFGLVNAVTSVARDATDPEVRWRLEVLGGGLLARMPERTNALETRRAVEGVYAGAAATRQ